MKQPSTSSSHRLLIELAFILSFVFGILAPFTDPAPAKTVTINLRSQSYELLVRRHDREKRLPHSVRERGDK